MQVLGWCDVGPDGVMQVLGWCDVGPGCAKFADLCREKMVDFFGMEMLLAEYVGNNQVFISEWTLSLRTNFTTLRTI